MNDHLRAIALVPKRRLFKFKAACDYRSVSQPTMDDMIEAGVISCYRFGREKRFKLEDLDKLIDSLPKYKYPRDQLAAV